VLMAREATECRLQKGDRQERVSDIIFLLGIDIGPVLVAGHCAQARSKNVMLKPVENLPSCRVRAFRV
jgi:hypothetical protein